MFAQIGDPLACSVAVNILNTEADVQGRYYPLHLQPIVSKKQLLMPF